MSELTDRMPEIGAAVVKLSLEKGADSAEALLLARRELSTKVRLGKVELLQRVSSRGLGLRVTRGQRTAVCHTADLSQRGVEELATEAVTVAGLAEPDPDAGPPDPELLAQPEELKRLEELERLDLFDEALLDFPADRAMDLAREGERAAMDHDGRITNSEGASFNVSTGLRVLVTSGGFTGSYDSTFASLVVEPVADDIHGKKRKATWWDGRRHLAHLASPGEIGAEAARRALAQLGARKIRTRVAPVVFSPEAGAQILSTLFGVVSGAAAHRRSTYLLEREHTRVASELVSVVDDPLLPAGPGSRPFDGDGLLSRKNLVLDRGIFTGFLCDTYAGRRLGRPSTGSAGRGLFGPPAVSSSNFFMEPGDITQQELLARTDAGLYVSHLMGFGVNPVTGDLSKGAQGFWIEGGRRLFPVSEVTVSANLDDLLRSIDLVAADLDHRTPTASPTFRVSQMTIAGT